MNGQTDKQKDIAIGICGYWTSHLSFCYNCSKNNTDLQVHTENRFVEKKTTTNQASAAA